MIARLFPLITLVGLTAVSGCASQPAAAAPGLSVSSILDGENAAVLREPDGTTFADVRAAFTPAELRFLHEHIGEVEQYVNARLQTGTLEAAWLAGYFRIESSLPLLRENLLTDRYFYGWEGPDPDQESSYLLDEQYTHHHVYIAAIEAITGRPLKESVALTPAEIEKLKAEADVDFAKRGEIPGRVERGLCARWLLSKLTEP